MRAYRLTMLSFYRKMLKIAKGFSVPLNKHFASTDFDHYPAGVIYVDCIFCKIINGQIPATIYHQDDSVIVFDDIHPQAPHHKLIVPRKHIATLNDLSEADAPIISFMIKSAATIARELGIADEGYRVVMNCNAGAGQSVFHIHMHLLGGRVMGWPPG